jgi:hypothetical protein
MWNVYHSRTTTHLDDLAAEESCQFVVVFMSKSRVYSWIIARANQGRAISHHIVWDQVMLCRRYHIMPYHIIISCPLYHIISYDIIWYHIISYHIISHNVAYHMIWYDIISYHVISYHIISYHIISCHVISWHILSYQIKSYHAISGILLYVEARRLI